MELSPLSSPLLPVSRTRTRPRASADDLEPRAVDEAFDLTKWQMKQEPERRRGLDREIAVASPPASLSPSTRNPMGDRALAEPDRHVSAIAKPWLVLWPVFHRILRLVVRVYQTGRTRCRRVASSSIVDGPTVSIRRSSRARGDRAPTPRCRSSLRRRPDNPISRRKPCRARAADRPRTGR